MAISLEIICTFKVVPTDRSSLQVRILILLGGGRIPLLGLNELSDKLRVTTILINVKINLGPILDPC